MASENTEVLFESWGAHMTGDATDSWRLFSPWRKRYVVLNQDETGAQVQLYDKKPRHDTPKSSFCLRSRYKIEKLFAYKGKKFVCRISNEDSSILIAFNDEKFFHLFAFFVQTQTKLREELESECFVVRPDNTESQQKIGARGNMCLLHISQHGVILALQLSKCILAWWPLRCIKCYESLSRQQFGLEAGRRAPMGQGTYVFNTRRDHDNAIYDRLDTYIMQAAGLTQIVYRSVSQHSDTSLDNSAMDMAGQLDNLHSLATVEPDMRFTSQLQRISRNIYDQLSNNHLGSMRKQGSRNSAESTNSSDPHDTTFNRSLSHLRVEQVNVTQPEPTMTSSSNHVTTQQQQQQCKDGATLPKNHSYENEEMEAGVVTSRQLKQQNVTSAYLSMNSQSNLNTVPKSELSARLHKNPNNNSTHFMDMHHQHQSLANSPVSPNDNQFLSLQHPRKTNAIPIVNFNANNDRARINMATSGGAAQQNSDDPNRPESFPRGERALSNQYTNQQFNLQIPRENRLPSSNSDPPTPYERMENLETSPVYPLPEASRTSGGSYIDDDTYPGPYDRKSHMYSYADPTRLGHLQANRGNVPQTVLGAGGVHSQEYLYPQNNHHHPHPKQHSYPPSSQQSHPMQQSQQSMQQSRDLKPPMMRPAIAQRPKDLYASPKQKQKLIKQPQAISPSNQLSPGAVVGTSNGRDKSPGSRSNPYEDFSDEIKDGIYESPAQSPEGLAFANNMFKEELHPTDNKQPAANNPKDDRPSLKLSLFHKQPSKPDIGANGRSVSISPITPPYPTTSHNGAPGSAARGINITPNTKSFKRSAPIEHSSPQSPALQTTFGPSPGGRGGGVGGVTGVVEETPGSLMRRQKSAGMEGRRLPSLPADAIIGDVTLSMTSQDGELSPANQQYEKVGADSFI